MSTQKQLDKPRYTVHTVCDAHNEKLCREARSTFIENMQHYSTNLYEFISTAKLQAERLYKLSVKYNILTESVKCE